MKLTARHLVAADPGRAYAALTDPAVLQRCIPGCEELVADGADTYRARIHAGVGSIKGTFTGRAELGERNPPHSFTLAVDGKGAPGFVRATAAITCTAVDAGTEIAITADIHAGGLIAAVGSRLIEAAARQQMSAFFGRVDEELKSEAPRKDHHVGT